MSDDELPETIESLPLDSWHREQGARMVPFAGYHMPIQYEGILAEHAWTRTHAGLFDVSHMGQLYLSGDGLDEALEAILPADVTGLKPGRMRYSLLLGPDGGILDDLMVTRWESGLYMVVNGATKWDDIAYLHEVLPDGVTLNHMDEPALLALQGPEAAQALGRLVPGVTELGFMTAGAFAIDGTDLWVSRSGYTGEDGFELSFPAAAAERIATLLLAQPEVKPIGLGARDSLRLEAGLPLYGHDLDQRTDPASANLAFAISKRRRSEGGFPGAEQTLGFLKDGPPTLRVGLALDGRLPAREGAPVYSADGQAVGRVTSGGFSPTLGRPIAMGYVAHGHAATGTALEVEVRGKRIPATVADMPFVPHRYHRKGVS